MKRTTRKALRNKADRLFSLAIRERDGNECRNCGSHYRLTCAHIVSRRYLAVRWDMLNAVCLCWACHFKFGLDPLGWEDWVIERMGARKYRALKLRARQGIKTVDLEAVVKALEGK